jgi:hypothetical protein
MALAKTLPFGEPADGFQLSYWRLVETNPDAVRGEVRYLIGGYSSQAAREAGAAPKDFVTDTLTLAASGRASVWEVTPNDLYAHAKRPQDSVMVTPELAQAQGYPAELIGQTVLQGAEPRLAGATDC